jgi:hypothetical protein
MRNAHKILVRKPLGKRPLEDQEGDGRIITTDALGRLAVRIGDGRK